MIFSYDDIKQELYQEFPDITPASIDRICTKGLFRLKKLLKSGRELITTGHSPELKFFIPNTPDVQFANTRYNIVKDNLQNARITKD